MRFVQIASVSLFTLCCLLVLLHAVLLLRFLYKRQKARNAVTEAAIQVVGMFRPTRFVPWLKEIGGAFVTFILETLVIAAAFLVPIVLFAFVYAVPSVTPVNYLGQSTQVRVEAWILWVAIPLVLLGLLFVVRRRLRLSKKAKN